MRRHVTILRDAVNLIIANDHSLVISCFLKEQGGEAFVEKIGVVCCGSGFRQAYESSKQLPACVLDKQTTRKGQERIYLAEARCAGSRCETIRDERNRSASLARLFILFTLAFGAVFGILILVWLTHIKHV